MPTNTIHYQLNANLPSSEDLRIQSAPVIEVEGAHELFRNRYTKSYLPPSRTGPARPFCSIRLTVTRSNEQYLDIYVAYHLSRYMRVRVMNLFACLNVMRNR